MTNDKTSTLSINVVNKTLKASDPLQNRIKIKQHTCDIPSLYNRRLYKVFHVSTALSKSSKKCKTLKDKNVLPSFQKSTNRQIEKLRCFYDTAKQQKYPLRFVQKRNCWQRAHVYALFNFSLVPRYYRQFIMDTEIRRYCLTIWRKS
jgi:hypothetical protein